MELGDSSSSTVANRDGGENGVLSVTAALAKEAALSFKSLKFAECLDALNQLKQKKENDPKVLHNIAITEFHRDGCSDPTKLLQVLQSVKKRSEELAHASREQVESISNNGSKGSGSNGSSEPPNCSNVVYMDEFDTSVATLNIAVILYHLHEYAKALLAVEPLYQNIEPIDETTALQICLLFLDVALACHDASRSAVVLSYLEKAFGVGSIGVGENGSTAQQSPSLVSKSSSVSSSSFATDNSNLDLAANLNASESPLSRSLSEETLEYQNALLEIGGRNPARPADLSLPNDIPRARFDRSISTVDLKLKLQLYKVRFLLLTRNLKVAKREIKHAMNIARGQDSSSALTMKAQLEYARGNHRKAIKLLTASSNGTEMNMSSMVNNNNLGCINYQLGRYHTSFLHFAKALRISSSLRTKKATELSTLSQNKSPLITYNCGMIYLARGNPKTAALCFEQASQAFFNQPRLWLRLAECCLMAAKESKAHIHRSEIRAHVIGKGKWRKLAVEDDSRVAVSGAEENPELSFSRARHYLSKALRLLSGSNMNNQLVLQSSLSSFEENEPSEVDIPGTDAKSSNISVGPGHARANGDVKGGTSQDIIQTSLSCYESVHEKEYLLIKQAALADWAYVELELEDHTKALSVSRSLLEIPNCSRIYSFLGHVYAAEALCVLGKPIEAGEHLSIYLSSGGNVELPFNLADSEQWRLKTGVDSEESNGAAVTAAAAEEKTQDFMLLTPEEAQGTLYANLAAVSAIQGDFDQAQNLVKRALSLVPKHPQATLTGIYVDLKLGKSEEALAKLKQCKCVRFLTW